MLLKNKGKYLLSKEYSVLISVQKHCVFKKHDRVQNNIWRL